MEKQAVVFSERAWNTIVAETYDKSPLETGGIFLGYVLEGGMWIVVEVVSPGWKTVNTVVDFEYDTEFVNYMANVINKQYDKQLKVLGLWHRHPGSMDHFSSTDDVTNKKFASHLPVGSISALVNIDPELRITVYHVAPNGSYTPMDYAIDHGDLIPQKYLKLKYIGESAEEEKEGDESIRIESVPSPESWEQVEEKAETAQSDKPLIDTSNPPTITIPANIIENHYVGPLMGYHVEDTNIYNILPIDTKIYPQKVRELGRIYKDARILDSYPGARDKISWLNRSFVGESLFDFCNRKPGPSPFLRDTEEIIGFWEDDKLHLISTKELRECHYSTYSLKLDVFSRNTGILESDVMLDKGAVIIGCGSVGSLLALELAKSGVGRFMLVDSDIFGYHNICRHQCGIYDVGRHKTDALKERILMINPYAEVMTETRYLQEVSAADIDAFCHEGDVMIACADNQEGDIYANKIAKEKKMPFVTLGCWNRAFAGDIFYCLPDDEHDYSDFVKAVGIDVNRVEQNRRFYTDEEDLKKVNFEPGIAADIDFITIIAVKLTIDLLNLGNETYTQRLTPYLKPYTVICNTNDPKIGGERAEIFSYPLQITRNITVNYD